MKLFNGVPNETRIIGKINGTVVYWETLKTPYKKKIASANLSVNETQRCAYYQVKFCNAPHLCSDYSNRYRLSTCAIRKLDDVMCCDLVQWDGLMLWRVHSSVAQKCMRLVLHCGQ